MYAYIGILVTVLVLVLSPTSKDESPGESVREGRNGLPYIVRLDLRGEGGLLSFVVFFVLPQCIPADTRCFLSFFFFVDILALSTTL